VTAWWCLAGPGERRRRARMHTPWGRLNAPELRGRREGDGRREERREQGRVARTSGRIGPTGPRRDHARDHDHVCARRLRSVCFHAGQFAPCVSGRELCGSRSRYRRGTELPQCVVLWGARWRCSASSLSAQPPPSGSRWPVVFSGQPPFHPPNFTQSQVSPIVHHGEPS
jgi:hypothetical protein